MSAAEKTLLRYQYVMANSQQVMGDFARTSDSWHNQLVLLMGGFQSLGSIVGGSLINAFKPFVRALNSVMLKVIQFAQVVSNALGAIFGWKYEGGGGISDDFSDAADSADDLADSTGDAAKNTKKMADNLQSFDKLNVISSSSDKGGGGSGGGGGASGAGSADSGGKWVETDSLWKKYTSSLNDLYKLGEYIGDVLTKTLNDIDWNRVYRGAEKFGSGLASFLNGLISPELFEAVGKTIANSLNTVLHGLDSFGKTFNWINFGNSIAAGINGFFLNFDFNLLVDTFNVWAVGLLNTIATAIDGVQWAEIARRIADALKRVDWKGLLEGVGKVFWAAFNAAVEVTSELLSIDKKTAAVFVTAIGEVVLAIRGFDSINKAIANVNKIYPALGNLFKITGPVKYMAIAAGISGIVLALDHFGIIDVNWNVLINGFKDLASALGKFAMGIGKGLISFIQEITPIISPVLEAAINGTAKAFGALTNVLDSIPESVISGITQALVNLFAIWKGTQFLNGIAQTVNHLYNLKDAFRLLGGLQLEGIKAAISGFFTSLGALPYAAIAMGIGLVIAKIMALTKEAADNSAIGQFSQAISDLNDEVSSKTDQINSSLESTRSAMETAGTGEAQVARDLAKEYEFLTEKTDLTLAGKERLKNVSEQLIDAIPELSQYVDKETGCLDVQKETLDELINKYEEMAKKQAAQEGLVEAYKTQYEAVLNSKRALDGYNEAFDKYISNTSLAPDVIKQLKDNQFDLSAAKAEFGHISRSEYESKYGVDSAAALEKAVNGLNKEMGEYRTTLAEAQDAEKKAGENVQFFKDQVIDCDKKIQASNDSILAGKMATDEYKQTLSDLTSEFQNIGLTLSDNFMQNLALEDGFSTSGLQEFFNSLSNGISASSQDIQNVFSELGMSIPINLANALAQSEPETQAAAVKILMSIQSGVEASSNDLKTLFGNLGYELPDAFAEKLAEKEPSVQTNTLNLLAKINEGYKLTEGNLKKLFSGLAVELSDDFINSLAGKESDVQMEVINLLGKIPAASDQQRNEIINKLKQLGIDGADGLKSGLSSKQSDVEKQTANVIDKIPASADKKAAEVNTAMNDLGADSSENLKKGIESGEESVGKQTEDLAQKMIDTVQQKSGDVTSTFDNLGISSADKLREGIDSKKEDVRTTTRDLVSIVKDSASSEFNSTTSGAMYDAGANASKGFWKGLKDWWDDTWLGRKISELKQTVSGMLEEHSPSKVMWRYGAYASMGFNEGLQSEMSDTIPMVQSWVNDLTSTFSGYQIPLSPVLDMQAANFALPQIPHYQPQLEMPEFSSFDTSVNYTAELTASLKGSNNELLKELKRNNTLLEQLVDKPIIDDGTIYNATRREVARTFKRTGRTGFKGID